MTAIPCPACKADTADGLLCEQDTDQLRADLDALPEWLSHLDDALARQTQTGTGNGGRKGETPVPYDDRASKLSTKIRSSVRVWVSELDYGDAPQGFGGRVRWLSHHIQRIRGADSAGAIKWGVHRYIEDIERLMDNVSRSYLGPCTSTVEVLGEGGETTTKPCLTQLYAPDDEPWYACPRCRTPYNVEARQSELFGLVEHQWASLEQCVNVLDMFGLPAELGYIKRWVATGHLVGKDGKYRVGDVADIARDRVAERVKGA